MSSNTCGNIFISKEQYNEYQKLKKIHEQKIAKKTAIDSQPSKGYENLYQKKMENSVAERLDDLDVVRQSRILAEEVENNSRRALKKAEGLENISIEVKNEADRLGKILDGYRFNEKKDFRYKKPKSDFDIFTGTPKTISENAKGDDEDETLKAAKNKI